MKPNRPGLWPACTYRVVRFRVYAGNGQRESATSYVAIAWEYDHAVLMSTTPHASYTAARRELDKLAADRECSLRYFDGEYFCAGNGASLDKLPEAEQSAASRLEADLSHCCAPFPDRD